MTTTIKITELTNIGANLASSTVIPVVNMAGTPTTEKTVLGNIANVVLAGAGGNYVAAARATTANTVLTNAQPNITSTGNLTGLTVSNATGVVNFSNTANVTLGNVSNLHIAGGTAGQLLSTNGNGTLSWASDTTTYGNSNVVSLLSAFGSNTISTTGNISVGNIIGNGQALSGITGANVSGFVPNANVANTAFAVAGANVSGFVPNANVANTAFAVAGANVSGFVPNANVANTAFAVAAANVSGLGNIALINNDGNASNVLLGNGVFGGVPASIPARIANGNSNVNIANGNGNVTITSNGTRNWNFDTTGNLTTAGDLIGPANANFTIHSNASAHEFVFGSDGTFYAPDNVVLGGNSIYIGPGANTLTGIEHEVFIASSNNFAFVQAVINNISDNGSADWVALGAKGNDTGGQASLGFTSSGFGDANYTITGNGDGYVFVQSYAPGQTLLGGGGNLVLTTGNNGTTKDIIFGTGGFLAANIFGRISHANNSLELSRTGASLKFPDGSVQTTAYTGGGANTGNVTFSNQIVLGTGSNDGSGGLYLAPGNASIANSAVQYLRVRGGDAPTHIHLDTGNNEYYDQYFGADSRYVKLEANGNVVINADDYNGNGASWTLDTTGNLTLPDTTSVIANVSITLEANDTGNITGLSVIGDANANLYAHGNVTIVSDSSNTNATWAFGTNGNLTLPGNLVIAGNTSVFGTNASLLQTTDNRPLLALSSGANGAVSSLWVEDVANVGTSNIAAVYANPTSGSKIVRIAVGQNGGGGPNLWDFGTTGNLTLPTGGQIIVSGGLVSSGASPAPSINGFSITNSVGISGNGNIAGNNISATGNISANNFTGNGGTLSNVATKVEGSWTLASGVNTVNISVPLNGTYTLWVNGNIPNGIITYTATAVVTNTNVPVLGDQYGWYYAIGNALVLTTIPDQFVGTVGSISNVNTYAGNTANVFTFGITNNSGNTAVVNYGYTKL